MSTMGWTLAFSLIGVFVFGSLVLFWIMRPSGLAGDRSESGR
jgi:hypothetical protein